ncbi:serine/threonine protein kinase [Streptomyces sp. B6B3]|uniref:protein kinase family protein n=1 Tax=Streptomyces sp. B6B3 TaxID=3153570 RepID=UPI00325E872F
MAERSTATSPPHQSAQGSVEGPARTAAERPDTERAGAAEDQPTVEGPPPLAEPGEPAAGDPGPGSEATPAPPEKAVPGASDAAPDASPDASPGSTSEAVSEAAEGPGEATVDLAAAPAPTPPPAELHSGHRLAKRYRLEECITRLDGFSSWRAVDEKLRRAVGIHVLPATHERAPAVLSAARAAALLGDPRFVQVLDAVEENDQVHVIHEWLPDAVPLSALLQGGPLDAHEAQVLASQVSEAMAAAHREGLCHLRLSPATVLRTGPNQYRIRGLAVDTALRGITAPDPQRADTEAIGAILYAALTQRWPYPEGAYGLDGVAGLGTGPRDVLAAPEQVRAGVHRRLSDLAMRALINNGATAASQNPPCTTAEELSQELSRLPRIPPAAPTPTTVAPFRATGFPSGGRAPGGVTPAPNGSGTMPTLPGRTGTALKWGVSALLIAALGLGSWQIADSLMKGDSSSGVESTPPPAEQNDQDHPPAAPQFLPIESAITFDPLGDGSENEDIVSYAIDDDPETSWHTENYFGPGFANLKPGLGIVLDLGEPRNVRSLNVEAIGDTSVEFRAAAPGVSAMPTDVDGYTILDQGTGESLSLQAEESIETRFVLVWLTELPMGSDSNYRGRITGISVSG